MVRKLSRKSNHNRQHCSTAACLFRGKKKTRPSQHEQLLYEQVQRINKANNADRYNSAEVGRYQLESHAKHICMKRAIVTGSSVRFGRGGNLIFSTGPCMNKCKESIRQTMQIQFYRSWMLSPRITHKHICMKRAIITGSSVRFWRGGNLIFSTGPCMNKCKESIRQTMQIQFYRSWMLSPRITHKHICMKRAIINGQHCSLLKGKKPDLLNRTTYTYMYKRKESIKQIIQSTAESTHVGVNEWAPLYLALVSASDSGCSGMMLGTKPNSFSRWA